MDIVVGSSGLPSSTGLPGSWCWAADGESGRGPPRAPSVRGASWKAGSEGRRLGGGAAEMRRPGRVGPVRSGARLGVLRRKRSTGTWHNVRRQSSGGGSSASYCCAAAHPQLCSAPGKQWEGTCSVIIMEWSLSSTKGTSSGEERANGQRLVGELQSTATYDHPSS